MGRPFHLLPPGKQSTYFLTASLFHFSVSIAKKTDTVELLIQQSSVLE